MLQNGADREIKGSSCNESEKRKRKERGNIVEGDRKIRGLLRGVKGATNDDAVRRNAAYYRGRHCKSLGENVSPPCVRRS